jgi:hypothetical protein
MEYEESIGLVTGKMKNDFHVLGLFMAKKHDLSEKYFSVAVVLQNLCHANRLPLRS